MFHFLFSSHVPYSVFIYWASSTQIFVIVLILTFLVISFAFSFAYEFTSHVSTHSIKWTSYTYIQCMYMYMHNITIHIQTINVSASTNHTEKHPLNIASESLIKGYVLRILHIQRCFSLWWLHFKHVYSMNRNNNATQASEQATEHSSGSSTFSKSVNKVICIDMVGVTRTLTKHLIYFLLKIFDDVKRSNCLMHYAEPLIRMLCYRRSSKTSKMASINWMVNYVTTQWRSHSYTDIVSRNWTR